ncbi:MAG: hypothetical protein R3A46_01780 [Thermomicrobiales bacterium]
MSSSDEQGRAREPRAGEITRIVHQQKNPERVSIYIDGEFAFGLPATEVVGRGLKRGQRLTLEDATILAAVDEGSRATDAAVQFIRSGPAQRVCGTGCGSAAIPIRRSRSRLRSHAAGAI